MISLIAFGFLSCIISFSLMGFFIRKASELRLIDIPNQRSSHVKPITRGGGLVFSSVYLILLTYFNFTDPSYKLNFAAVLIICPIVLVVGWLDDRFNLSALTRLFFQIILSLAIASILTDSFKTDVTLLFLPSIFWLNFIFIILYISWFTNLYNFMDGADGLAASMGIVGAMVMVALSYMLGANELSMAYLLIGASLVGFMPWNWSPAKIFMGESGSYFLGINFATLALIGDIKFNLTLYASIIIFGLFIVDTTFTLFVRVFRGQNPLAAHQHFAFHKLIKRGWSHQKVSLLYTMIALFWLAPLSYLSVALKSYSFIILVVSYIPLIGFVSYMRAGKD